MLCHGRYKQSSVCNQRNFFILFYFMFNYKKYQTKNTKKIHSIFPIQQKSMKFGICTARNHRTKTIYGVKRFLYFLNVVFNHKNKRKITQKITKHFPFKVEAWNLSYLLPRIFLMILKQ